MIASAHEATTPLPTASQMRIFIVFFKFKLTTLSEN